MKCKDNITFKNVFVKDFGEFIEVVVSGFYVKVGEQKKNNTKRGNGKVENKEKNKEKSAFRAASMIRSLIIMNNLCYFWTLTYSREEEEVNQVNKDFNLFIKKLKYNLKQDKLDYVAVKEIQENRAKKYGARVWHIHLCLNQFVDMDIMNKSWGNGFVLVKKFNDDDIIKNAGYLAKYIKKDIHKYHEDEKKRYFRSQGLIKPDRFSLLISDDEIEVLRKNAGIKVSFENEKMEWLRLTNDEIKSYSECLEKNGIV